MPLYESIAVNKRKRIAASNELMDLGYVYTYPYAMAADFSKRETTRWRVLPGEST